MKVRNHHDLWAGLMFIGFGVVFMALAQQYQIGSAAKMGPGYFPTILGGLLAVLGTAIAAGSMAASAHEARVAAIGWREIVLVLLAVLLFAFALPRLGIVLSLVILIFTSALASHEFSFRDTVIACVFLLVLSYLVFVKGLELQFLTWPKFLMT